MRPSRAHLNLGALQMVFNRRQLGAVERRVAHDPSVRGDQGDPAVDELRRRSASSSSFDRREAVGVAREELRDEDRLVGEPPFDERAFLATELARR